MTKQLIVDIDGVIADTLSPALIWFNEYYKTRYTILDIDRWDFQMRFPIGGDAGSIGDWMIYVLKDPMFHRNISPYPGAAVTLNDATVDGWEVTLATARPEESKEFTEEWLAWNMIPYHRLVFGEDKDHLVGHLMIEDYHENLFKWSRNNGSIRPGLLFNKPYNKIAKAKWPIQRVNDWVDIDAYLGGS